MGYLEILATGLTWYAIGGVTILIGSVIVYGLAVMIYRLLARLARLTSQVAGYITGHTQGSPGHHPFG